MTIKFGTTDGDALFGQNGDDLLEGKSGDDTLIGGNHDDILHGESGDDTLIGGNHDDILHGESGDDTLIGGNHDDILYGESGDDLLEGGSHNDLLDGGSGNDTLNGEIGQDTLIGGDGVDSFVFTSLDGFDLIVDFDSNLGDKIIFDITATGVDSVGDLEVHIGTSQINTSDFSRVTSIYFDGERVMEFDGLVSLEVEDFEFI